jgi:hypothetical protein
LPSLIKPKKHKILISERHRISTIELWDNYIVYINIDDNEEILIEDSIKHNRFLKNHFNGKDKFLILVEPGAYTEISKEAREFSSKPENNLFSIASAVITKSLAHRLIVNFIIKIVTPKHIKFRMFDEREEAINWLLEIKNTTINNQ